ncbi:LAQU0S05e01970g1_1 [Lachancea quebecensis]|uniref:LAQU0S05e01970g1_1 n=1 Tax=Lachancea quebecensis TaxID=1654605 RepID=A0A0P1KRG9_9SACH|nr:LAQU0S05e01970g1_1 [Lachancea quebecensis]
MSATDSSISEESYCISSLSRSIEKNLKLTPSQGLGSAANLAGVRLHKIESETEFSTFLTSLVSALKNLGYSDLIPSKNGISRKASFEERAAITTLIDEYAPHYARPRVPFIETTFGLFIALTPQIELGNHESDIFEKWENLSFPSFSDMPTFLARVSELLYLTEEVGWRNKSHEICTYIRNSIPEEYPDVISIVDESSPNVKQVTDRLMKYAFNEEYAPQQHSPQAETVSNETPWLSYEDVILGNKDVAEKLEFQNAYEKELSHLEKFGTWDVTKPRNAHSTTKAAIIDTVFRFKTYPHGEKCCRIIQKGSPRLTIANHPIVFANVTNVALLTCLSVALEKDWVVKHLDSLSDCSSETPRFIPAPPHLLLKDIVLPFQLRGSESKRLLTKEQYLYCKIIDAFQLREVELWPGVLIRGAANCCAIICMMQHEMILMSSSFLAQEILDGLAKFHVTYRIKSEDSSLNPCTDIEVQGLKINYLKGSYMKLGMGNGITQKLEKRCLATYGKPVTVPGSPRLFPHRQHSEYVPAKKKWFCATVCFLEEVSLACRFEISYYVSALKSYELNPNETAVYLAEYILRYLETTKDRCIFWRKSGSDPIYQLNVTTDASFASQEDYRSQCGLCYTINGNCICAHSEKATVVCMSSVEAELEAIAISLPRLLNLAKLLESLNCKVQMRVVTDCRSVLDLIMTENPKLRNYIFGSKLNRVRQEMREAPLSLEHIMSQDNFTDLLTKPLEKLAFEKLVQQYFTPHNTPK